MIEATYHPFETAATAPIQPGYSERSTLREASPAPGQRVMLRPRAALSAAEVAGVDRRMQAADPFAAVAWARHRFGSRLCLLTSFSDTLLVDVAMQVDPDIAVVFLDTGFHFAETLATMRQAQQRYRLDLRVIRPAPDAADVWSDGSESCCHDRKVAPLRAALEGNFDCWLSGVRRDDSATRANAPAVVLDGDGRVKVNPLVTWTADQAARYAAERHIVVNPLQDEGYPSIGCWPCTEPVVDGADPRSGRWAGSEKTECGLHL